jgi:c-di-GMP-related signal transduction protein
MDIYVARQAIFDKQQKVFGYELLYRSGLTNHYDGADGTEASLSVIRNTFLFLGQRLMEAKRVFINFTRPLLLHGVAETLPPQHTVVEILEDIQPDEQIVTVCQELKDRGYTIALDDYSLANEMQNRLLELADIIKVDTISAGTDESHAIARKFAGTSKLLVAEGVESIEDFRMAETAGFSLFQGYFFSKPVIIPGKDIPRCTLHDMGLLEEVGKRDLDFKALENIIKQDLSLCYTLLKYINSAYFGLRDEITSIMQAMILLGETEVRKWAFLALVTFIAGDKPPEIIVDSLIRANMCELLAGDVNLNGHEPELFLLGIFSMLDVLIGRPFTDILEGMNLAPEIKLALLGKESPYGDLYRTVVSYDKGDWEGFERLSGILDLNPGRMLDAYINSVAQADRVVHAKTASDV